MATEQFRSDANAAIEAWRLANFPDVPAFYENGPQPDELTVGPIWIDVSIRWYGAKLVTMGDRPLGRHTGVVSVNVFHREGEGTALPDQVIDSVKELLRARRLGAAVLYMPQRQIPTSVDGWYKTGVFAPFTLDDA
ncbi:hypothetical protein H4CHR_02978 [Variovorax sp. PBS-H4]|uniref:phage tail terminator-like protein n=1 Tax=Variovorax sp. PBS-H4 TaxID=434008 RepID=UPI001316BB3B|nr:phage tail terminator-like protein [Variovorax sp. PBS-H4]VTU32269.1 hypothetical protein H4CHR_02978 [Variovorax sp. PBS-H4]